MIPIKRSPAPVSLEKEKNKVGGDYKCVMPELEKDFRNKCYICESRAPQTLNVEHLKSHQGNVILKFAWENLFLSCGHCNSCKLDLYDEILDCTNPKHNVLGWIKYNMKPFPGECVKLESQNRQKLVKNTVDLLNRVYNGSHTNTKKCEARNLRSAILKEIGEFQKSLTSYFDDATLEKDKQEDLRSIRRHLSPCSAFTAFKYWIVMENSLLRKELESHMDAELKAAFTLPL